MSTKSVIISSSGLKNIALNRYTDDDDFILIFGEHEFRMKSFFAEFISPVVSNLHQSDPTIQSIDFSDLVHEKSNFFNKFAKDIVSEDIIFHLKQISSGNSIEIDDIQAFKLRLLSIILGNEELFNKINELFPPDFTNENFDTYLNFVQYCYYFSQFSQDFDFSSLIDFIAGNFYLIDSDKFLKLPRLIQYYIISNPHLQVKTEDLLFDIICEIINNENLLDEKENEKIDDILFLEQIEFTSLSESKLREFLNTFDFNQITYFLWQKFNQCFFIHFNNNTQRLTKSHSQKETFEYIENKTDQFDGIIHHLTEKFGGNVDEKGVCKISSSSQWKNFVAKNVTEYEDDELVFATLDKSNSWIKFEFIGRKVQPTHYSIQTWRTNKNDAHLKSWVFEGSNNDKDWVVLDSRKNNSDLNSVSAKSTFKIEKSLNDDEFFKFIRIKQNGPNWKNTNQLIINVFELFGSIV